MAGATVTHGRHGPGPRTSAALGPARRRFAVVVASEVVEHFRTPRIAWPIGRKRFAFFSRSPEVMQRVALHLASHTLAPSEDPDPELGVP
jgi:hypothetical protein